MAYSDNYPNGYKSGYSSADDPGRRDYSPSGVASQQRDALAASYERERKMSEYNAGVERERQRQQRLQEQQEMEESKRQQEMKQSDEHMKMYIESVKYVCEQKRNNYKKMSLFSRAIATLKGKGYYKTPFWDLAVEEVDKMSKEELADFHRRNVR